MEFGEMVEPGLSITANGTKSEIRRQRSHLWKVAKLSAPMIHTKLAFGLRDNRICKVSAVKRVFKCFSNAQMRMSG